MTREELEAVFNGILEELAAIEHERWSHWQRFVHGKAVPLEDGALAIPAALAARWDKQMRTPYEDLSEVEKKSDREQVKKYIGTVIDALLVELHAYTRQKTRV